MALGIIGGTSLFDTKLLGDVMIERNWRVVKTEYGTVHLNLFSTIDSQEIVFLPRHGKDRNIPPHRINYKANIRAFKDLGIMEIIGITSVGSLKYSIKPQSLIVPHDYISLGSGPTYYDYELVHVTPCLDEGLRKHIIGAARDAGIEIIERGVYFQTTGPRLETKAEINFMKDYADIVGMSMASEATLAREAGLRYADISTVDNYAHGIIDGEALDYTEIVEAASKNMARLESVLQRLMEVIPHIPTD
ncbi:MAG: MTAP family purine nucleoside phosphorylase [Methanophagales archaeon]|nr:MTAP family purine nucleoside phosphorylase [Methanophagales archaeon]